MLARQARLVVAAIVPAIIIAAIVLAVVAAVIVGFFSLFGFRRVFNFGRLAGFDFRRGALAVVIVFVIDAVAIVIRVILIVFAVSRAIQLGVLLGVSVTTRVFAQPVQGGIANLLCRFDCEWYVRVATEGPGALSRTEAYATGYAFFPLYPSTVAIVSQLTGLPPFTAGFVLSKASSASQRSESRSRLG